MQNGLVMCLLTLASSASSSNLLFLGCTTNSSTESVVCKALYCSAHEAQDIHSDASLSAS